MSLLDNTGQQINQWPTDRKLEVLAELQWANWLDRAGPTSCRPTANGASGT